MFPQPNTATKFQTGITLIELLVSMFIALIILGGVVQLVVSSKQSFLDQEESSYIQQNARFAFDVVMRDLKSSGFYGCGGANAYKSIVYKTHSAIVDAGGTTSYEPGAANGFIGLDAVTGFDGESGYTNFPAAYKDDIWQKDATGKTDSFIVRRGLGHNPATVLQNTPSSKTLVAQFDDIYTDEVGNQSTDILVDAPVVVVAANCSAMGLFKATAVAPESGSNRFQVRYQNAGNCDSALKPDVDNYCDAACNCDSTNTSAPYSPGSTLIPFSSAAYYIAESDIAPGVPALMRSVLQGSTNAPLAEEVASGVEDMQIEYAVTADTGTTQYYTAKELSDAGLSWNDVDAVSLSLVFRSQFEILNTATSQTLLDKTYNDRFVRQVVATTLQIRNRI